MSTESIIIIFRYRDTEDIYISGPYSNHTRKDGWLKVHLAMENEFQTDLPYNKLN